MHIKTRLDLIMEALCSAKMALDWLEVEGHEEKKAVLVKQALEKIDKAYDAAHGTEERPGT